MDLFNTQSQQPQPVRIVRLTVENFKRLRVVAIERAGNVVTLAGDNGAGKSSVLDAITTALSGVDAKLTPKPIRAGADRADIVLELGDDSGTVYTVRRKFTGTGSTLEITGQQGEKYPSPQAVLNGLTGDLAFDPLAFKNMRPADQMEALRRAMGVDFTDLDAEYSAKFAERTGVNRDVDRLRTEANMIQVPPDAPDAPVSVSDLAAQLSAASRTNAANAEARRNAEDALRRERNAEQDVAAARAELARLESEHARLRDIARDTAAQVDSLQDIDIDPIGEKMRDAETLNAAHRAKIARAEKDRALADARAKSEVLSKRLDGIKDEKRARLAAVEFSVKGLEFGDDGILLDGVPFVQASTAQQLRTSIAVGMASNPKLRVMLVRDGSLFDKHGIELVREMAKDGGYQFWIEDTRADTDGPGVVEIVDGGVVK